MSPTRFGIRDAQPGDMDLIYDSWLRSFASARPGQWKGIGGERLLNTHRKLIESLMKRSRTRVLCDIDCPQLVLGWICVEGDCLHYVYVKRRFRKHGICAQLVSDAGILLYYSHPSQIAARWLGKKLGIRPSFGHLFYPPQVPHGEARTEARSSVQGGDTQTEHPAPNGGTDVAAGEVPIVGSGNALQGE